ncbi:MAG: twin-arginine translocation signal domain-containing protein, partial [Caldilineaceae bacterium]
PDADLAGAGGLDQVATKIDQGYCVADVTRAQDWMPAPTQVHGAGDHYRVQEAEILAWMGATLEETTWPAVTLRRLGAGSIGIWCFDPVASIVLTRQGNPAWAGAERDGRDGLRAQDLFVGWIDLSLIEAPQADLQMRFLSRMIHEMLALRLPLPRMWYFPGGARSVLVATGDSHSNPAAAIDEVLSVAEKYGGAMSIYFSPPVQGNLRRFASRSQAALTDAAPALLPAALQDEQPTPAQVAAWRARGHEFGIHPYVDEGLEAGWARDWQAFTGRGYGPVPPTTRTHAILWSGWTETARVQAGLGIGMNLDFYHYGPVAQRDDGTWAQGYLTGSGIPMRFVDEQGQVLAIYQQLTNLVDEHLLQMPWGMGGANVTIDEAIAQSRQLIDASVRDWPAAIGAQFHVDPFTFDADLRQRSLEWMEGTLAHCRQAAVPILSAETLLSYTELRNRARMTAFDWNEREGRLHCAVSFPAGAAGGTNSAGAATVALLLPERMDKRRLRAVEWDGVNVPFGQMALAGMVYGLVNVPAQNGNLGAVYGGDA